MEDGLRKIGGDPTRLAEARLAPHSFCCYLELHIEQGGTLDKSKIPIGVVEGIVSIDEYEAEIRGFANHAGTTPMPDRRNALLAAAKLIEAVQDAVTREPGRQVGTVGQLQVFPNAHNVVPGLARLSIELRDLSAEKIARLGADGDDFCAQPPGHQSCTERAYFVGGLREWSERAARNASSPRRPLRRETVQFLAVRLQDLPLMLTTTGCARVFVPLPRAVYSYYGQYTHHACAARASFSAVL